VGRGGSAGVRIRTPAETPAPLKLKTGNVPITGSQPVYKTKCFYGPTMACIATCYW